MKTLYQTKVLASGGRNGQVKSEDGLLDISLSLPTGLGGTGKASNPEQLFAAGYAACFENAVLHVATQKKLKLTGSQCEAQVSLAAANDGRFHLDVTLDLALDGIDAEQAHELIKLAHEVCPYSNATRGNLDVKLLHKGESVS